MLSLPGDRAWVMVIDAQRKGRGPEKEILPLQTRFIECTHVGVETQQS